MTGLRRRLVAIGLGVLVVGAVIGGLEATSATSGSSVAASFTLPRLGGGPAVRVPVVDHGREAPVVLTFFASWCGPCNAELPTVASVARQLTVSGSPVEFVGVDGNDLDSSGLALVHRAGVAFAVGADHTSAIAPRFGIGGYPATVFIDRDGTVAHVVRGPVTASVLRTWAARIARSA